MYKGQWVLYSWLGDGCNQDLVLNCKEEVIPFSYAKIIGVLDDSSISVLTYKFNQHIDLKTSGILRFLPTPTFDLGDFVRVRKGSKAGLTFQVEKMVWHHKDEVYYYSLKGDARLLSKRYLEINLEKM